MTAHFFLSLAIVLATSLAWTWFDDRNAALREATRRAKRKPVVMLQPLPVAQVAIATKYRRSRSTSR